MVHRIPALLVVLGWLGFIGRFGNHLPPEKAVQVLADWSGDHAVGDIKICEAVMVEVPGVARPGPSAVSNLRQQRGIFKSAVAAIPEQRVAHGVFLIQRADFGRRVFLEVVRGGNAFAGGGPHIGHVKIRSAIVVVIGPRNAHARADVFHAGLGSDVGEGSVSVVAVEILAAKIVHNI